MTAKKTRADCSRHNKRSREMGNKQKRVGYSTHNKRRNRQLDISKLQHANNARLQANPAQVPENIESLSSVTK